jgi:hypothetical protein
MTQQSNTRRKNTNVFDIEKSSLEAHVSLCAERYEQFNDKLDVVERRLNNIEYSIKELKDLIIQDRSRLDDKFLKWGASIITVLATIIGYLITRYITK